MLVAADPEFFDSSVLYSEIILILRVPVRPLRMLARD
jgi:hypothetical protein